ncbi:ABC transporter permease, partial [Mesorhizobium sp. M8A.F.Ca.ET.023.02.2.1]
MTSPIAPDLTAGRMPAKPRAGVWRRLIKRRLALLGLVIVAIVVAGAILAPWLTGYDPNEQMFDGLTIEGSPLPPTAKFWLGTDLLGRDLLTRILYGARTSLIIGIVANGVALLIGTLVGVSAGYFRGWVGSALMRFTDR